MKVKCLTCQHLKACHDPDGMTFRCSLGFYDTEEGVPVYYAASGLVHGNVGVWKASRRCGDSYTLAKLEL